MSKISILDRTGNPMEIELDTSIYREAHDAGCTVPQLLEQKFGDKVDAEKHGNVTEQVAASSGLFFRPDQRFGLRAPRMSEIFDGKAGFNAGAIVREAAPVSRLIFPAVVLEMIENALVKDYASQPAIFDSMIAQTDTVAGPRYERPVVNFTRPAAGRSQGIAQGALPAYMMTLTVSDEAKKIPTFAIGLEMTDEALKATTLDFVTLSLQRQVEVERDARVEGYISALVSGDADHGQSALGSVTSDSLHAATAAGALSHTAWMKFLYRNRRTRQVSHIICDFATAMKIENRENKPTVSTDDPNSPRIDTLTNMLNPGAASSVKLFLVDDGVVAADTIVALDSRYAIRRVRNSEAEYQAAEEFVMKRMKALRFDFGEVVYRMFDDAWDVMTISA
jgi:hypothetical protein